MRPKWTRPGPGWKHISGPVWEHTSGRRIHTMGFVRLEDGSFRSLFKWPECVLGTRLVRINGGNRKRALMAWART